MKFALFIVLAFAVSAFGAVISPSPSSPCPQGYVMSSSNLPTRDAAVFVPNELHYNVGNLMGGSPDGPWFDIEPSSPCVWFPNGEWHCKLRLYSSPSLGAANLIGNATIDSSFFQLNADQYNTSGGFISYSQYISPAISAGFPSTAAYVNFRSLTTQVYFQPEQVWPPTGVPLVNRVENIGGTLYLSLWGSNGWNNSTQQFDNASVGTGMDVRFGLTCPTSTPPPIIPGCPCDDPAAVFNLNYGCVQYGVPVRRTGQFCVELSFNDALSCPTS